MAEELVNISPTRGMVRKGELIVPKNGIVTADIYNKLRSFKEQYEEEITEKKSFWGVFSGLCPIEHINYWRIPDLYVLFYETHIQQFCQFRFHFIVVGLV